jgi:hypothetical protein
VNPRVYSWRFIKTNTVNAYVTYTVPSGRRAVVTYCTVTNFSAAAAVATALAGGSAIWKVPNLAPQTSGSESMRVVVMAGESIQLYLAGEVMQGYVSGYLFLEQTAAAEDPVVDIPGPPPDGEHIGWMEDQPRPGWS